MAVCLCDISAQWFWRHYAPKSGEPVFGHTPGEGPTIPDALPVKTMPVERDCHKLTRDIEPTDYQRLCSMGLSAHEPLHVLLARAGKVASSRSTIVHTVDFDLPAGTLLRCGGALCVTSPEMTLLRACAGLSLVERLKLAYEYCGCYSIRPELEGGLVIRHPITSLEELGLCLESSIGMTGAKQLRRILPYVRNGSGSPRETALVLLCCLPKKHGGFGLPFPRLNVSLDLGSGSAKLWGRGNAFDLVWEGAKVILEYDGELGHATSDQRNRDQRRREAAQSAGYSVFALDKRRIESVSDTFAVIEKVAERLSFRLRFPSGFRERHLELRSQLL